MRSNFFLILALCLFKTVAVSQDSISYGELNLGEWTYNEKEIVLDCNWEFFPGKVYTPENIPQSKSQYSIQGGKTWNDIEVDGKPFGAFGVGTVRLTITGKNFPDELGFWIKSNYCGTTVFANGKRFNTPAKVSEDPDKMVHQYFEGAYLFHSKNDSIVIIGQIGNFVHRKGGFTSPFRMGTFEYINKLVSNSFNLVSVQVSSLIIIGLFFLIMFLFRARDRAIFYFSIFSLALSIYMSFRSNYLITHLFPDIPFGVVTHVEYLSFSLTLGFAMLFLKNLYQVKYVSHILKFGFIVTLFMVAITIVFPLNIYSYFAVVFIFLIVMNIPITFWILVVAIRRKETGSNILLSALLVLICTASIGALGYLGLMDRTISEFIIGFGLVAFVFAMSMTLGYRFAISFNQVEKLKIETEKQNEDIKLQAAKIEKQHEELSVKNKRITNSINYAKRIQQAVFPPKEMMTKYFPESFIFFRPRDVVSGDFYWFYEKGDWFYFSSADCTGHGIPGAFISILGSNYLERVVGHFDVVTPAEILDELNLQIIGGLTGQGSDQVKDGMDISLFAFNFKTGEFQFAGAYNPLYIINNNELKEVKADRVVIGAPPKKSMGIRKFTNHVISYQKGDCMYSFSDGFSDQFGGPSHRKFSSRKFKETLLEIHNNPMIDQEDLLSQTLSNWMGDYRQMDDVLVLGWKM